MRRQIFSRRPTRGRVAGRMPSRTPTRRTPTRAAPTRTPTRRAPTQTPTRRRPMRRSAGMPRGMMSRLRSRMRRR